MSIIKSRYIFAAINVVVVIVWVFTPEVNTQSVPCYENIFGTLMSYESFNKYQKYYFLIGTFIFTAALKGMSLKGFIVAQLLLMIPVLLKLYIYFCSR
jgi:hypothetical protein